MNFGKEPQQTSLKKHWFFAKYLCTYRINHAIKESSAWKLWQSWKGVNFTNFRQIIAYLHYQSRKKKKTTHFRHLSGKKFIFQQPMSEEMGKCDYFGQNNCLLTRPNCKVLHVSATNRERRAILSGCQKHNCILMWPILKKKKNYQKIGHEKSEFCLFSANQLHIYSTSCKKSRSLKISTAKKLCFSNQQWKKLKFCWFSVT